MESGLDRPDHVGDRDRLRGLGEAIASLWPAAAPYDPGRAQFGEDVLQEAERDRLCRGDRLRGDAFRLLARGCQFDRRANRVVGLGRDPHRCAFGEDVRASPEQFKDLGHCLFDAGDGRIDSQLRLFRTLVGRVDAGEALDLSRQRFGVEAFGVAPRALLDRSVDKDLDERQVRLQVRVAQMCTVGGQRRDQRGHRNRAGVGHQPRHLTYTPDVLGALGRRETKVLREPDSDVVAVEQVRRLAAVHQAAFKRNRDG